MRNVHFYILGVTLSTFGILNLHSNEATKRTPASSASQSYSLEIKTMNIVDNSLLQEAMGSELRATFQRKHSLSLARVDQNFLNQAADEGLNIKLNIDPAWIENDQLEFKLELVKTGFIDRVLVRCAQVSKRISDYNRSYQCFLKQEETAFISYRLSNDKDKTNPALAKRRQSTF